MAKLLKLRRGTTTQHGSFTGAEGEVTVDTDKETLVVHDGSTAGGHPVAAEDMANVSSASIAGRLANDSIATSKIAAGALPSDVTIASANIVNGSIAQVDMGSSSVGTSQLAAGAVTNDKVSASAAIAGTKISTNFGSQNIVTTGSLNCGDITTSSHINLGDSQNLRFGAGNDLQIFHDGSNSFLTNATGIFRVRSNDLRLEDQTNGHSMITAVADGAVELYHDNSKKLQTQSGGVRVFGDLENHDDDFVAKDNCKFIAGNGNDLTLVHDGNNSTIDSNTGTLIIQSDGGGLKLLSEGNIILRDNDDTTNMIRCLNGTQVELYYNGSKKFQTESYGVSVTGNLAISGTIAGRNVASDGSKLDGIESGATADQTGAEIASALNGQNIYTTGNIGRDSNDFILFDNNDRMDIFVNGSNEFRFRNNGDFHADGDVIAQSTTISSDRRLKENIEVVPNALDKIQALNGVTFDWKKTGEKSAGVIAQEVLGVLPEAVKEVTPVGGGDSHLSVNYHALTSILIEAIKDLKAEIEELKGGK